MLSYTNIRVHTSEKVRYQGKPVAEAIVHHIHSLKIAARCAVFRAREGLYETGELSSDSVADLSYNLPLLIDIFIPSSEAEKILETLKIMVQDGAVCILPVEVLAFQSGRHLLPAHLKVRDVMSEKVVQVHPDFTVRNVVETLIDQKLKSVPVVDSLGLPVGMVTQKDLDKTSIPVRPGLFRLLSDEEKAAYLRRVETLPVTRIMSVSPVVIRDDSKVSEAVHLMVAKQKKRLPVVDHQGKIVGFLSRIDLLKAVSSGRTPEAGAQPAQAAQHPRTVRDIANLGSPPLLADTDLHAAVGILVKRGEQRAAVVDHNGKLLGIVTDQDIFKELADEGLGMSLHRIFQFRKAHHSRVSDVMQKNVVTVTMDSSADSALALMVDRGFKRLPVVDETGIYLGLVRQDALLITLSHDL